MELEKNADRYAALNVPIVVIVGQKREAVRKWLHEHPKPFPFLIDENREVIKAFDVYHPIGIDAFKIAHPSVFLISADQKIVFAYVGSHQADRPPQDVTDRKVKALLDETFSAE